MGVIAREPLSVSLWAKASVTGAISLKLQENNWSKSKVVRKYQMFRSSEEKRLENS
jgi:hypothetical protein